MKTLDRLSNIERAKLLSDLFADDLPAYVAFANELTHAIVEYPAKLKEKAIEQIQTTEWWMELVNHAKVVFDRYGNTLGGQSTAQQNYVRRKLGYAMPMIASRSRPIAQNLLLY